MQRHQLEHIIRAASGITGAPEFVIVGSQTLLGQFPQAPDELLVSIEADLFSLHAPEDSDLIDGSIGEGSPFHMTFGYYAHGVGAETAVLPAGWRDRLIPLRNENTGGGAGLCLEVHDCLQTCRRPRKRPRFHRRPPAAPIGGCENRSTAAHRHATRLRTPRPLRSPAKSNLP